MIVKVATPLPFSGALRAVAPSTLNDAFPVGVPDNAETVTCTTPAAGYVTVGALMLMLVVVTMLPTLRVNICVVEPTLFFAVNVTEYEPESREDGVPLRMPVSGFSVNPAGSVPISVNVDGGKLTEAI